MKQLATVIVLAAGKGERFKASGASDDKLNALLGGQRVRDHVLSAVHASGLPFHVVEREHTAHLNAPGMGDSIACGVAATPDASGWLIRPPRSWPITRSALFISPMTWISSISTPLGLEPVTTDVLKDLTFKKAPVGR